MFLKMETFLPKVKRVIGIGDIHSDLELIVSIFFAAKLINDDFEWIANPPDTIVVQVGDQIDGKRGEEKYLNKCGDIMTLLFFETMNIRAMRKGGKVISLIGNHELMNVIGRFDYVADKDLYGFSFGNLKGEEGRRKAFVPGGPLAKLLSKRLSVVAIGSSLFVHAGILPEHLVLGLHRNPRECLEEFNKKVSDYLAGKMNNRLGSGQIPRFITDCDSPFWTRIYGGREEDSKLYGGSDGNNDNNDNNEKTKQNRSLTELIEEFFSEPINPRNPLNEEDNDFFYGGNDVPSTTCEKVEQTLDLLSLKYMIVGHTPQKDHKINNACGGKLYRIDGGFSRAFYPPKEHENTIQYIEILNDDKPIIRTAKRIGNVCFTNY